MINKRVIRCEWAGDDPIYCAYHDNEWGKPSYDDDHLFEMLILEGAQAGLSWRTILNKRQGYREVFDDFDRNLIMRYTDEELEAKSKDSRIIRNRLKVFSVRTNAICFQKVVDEYGSFSQYLWRFVGGKPMINYWQTMNEVPAKTDISDALSKDMKKRGFKFTGSTICYAYMQSVGLVNDHVVSCFCRENITGE
jgi:DNA-3-methyladenine glycosylase I